jgi:hypothetical protein
MVGAPQAHHEKAGFGLRREALSPVETLAQSVSTISPTAAPVATIPLVCALAGNLIPVPEGVCGKLPLIFLGYVALGLSWFFWNSKIKKPDSDEEGSERTRVD